MIDARRHEDPVRRRIEALVKELDENYFAVVQIDNSYVL